jgi:muconolactone delta-isomerase
MLKLVCSVALLVSSLAAVSSSGVVMAQHPTDSVRSDSATKGVDVDRIVRAFTAKETEFRQALSNYAFKRDATIQTIGMGGGITGEYRRVSQFSLDDRGELFEKITFFPQPTLTEISFTQEDLEDLGGVQPFALVAAKLNQYNFQYVGKERIDEIDTYVFDVQPKVIPKRVSERFFQGRVWVDDRDLQIVKVRGKGVPEGDQRFPTFETYRQQIDGRYWFPTYTYADDELVFKEGQTVHLRMTVRYTDFKRFGSEVKIIEVDGDEMPDEKLPSPKPNN